LHTIDEIVVSVDDDSVWCLPWGHVVRALLKLHHLLVVEGGTIVNESHAVEGLAVRTNCWLSDSPSIDLYGLGLLAHIAPASIY
jgi:hypothetical protein